DPALFVLEVGPGRDAQLFCDTAPSLRHETDAPGSSNTTCGPRASIMPIFFIEYAWQIVASRRQD
ncbi:MAG TPA: hypothetical protein DCL75_07980, partial [Ktedonobacter sp.]|nr:hypothetical protein [Ktedonobacter sp.]